MRFISTIWARRVRGRRRLWQLKGSDRQAYATIKSVGQAGLTYLEPAALLRSL